MIQVVAGEGRRLPGTGTCEDFAGNTASDTRTVNIDRSTPAVTIDETVYLDVGSIGGTAADGLSGVAQVTVVFTGALGEVSREAKSGRFGKTSLRWHASTKGLAPGSISSMSAPPMSPETPSSSGPAALRSW